MADGWKCPDCGLILAPHVSEHRCDPPGGVGSVTRIDPPGTGGAIATLPSPGVTVTVTGSVASERELADTMRAHVLRYETNSWRGSWTLPGRAA